MRRVFNLRFSKSTMKVCVVGAGAIGGMPGVVIELGEQTNTPTPAMNTVFALVSLLNKTVQEEGIKVLGQPV